MPVVTTANSVGRGINEARFGTIGAVVKQMDTAGLAGEYMALVLAQQMGVTVPTGFYSVPDRFWVSVRVEGEHPVRDDNGETIFDACGEDVTAMVEVFDYLINNCDRHQFNFLLDNGRCWLIDNEFAGLNARWRDYTSHISSEALLKWIQRAENVSMDVLNEAAAQFDLDFDTNKATLLVQGIQVRIKHIREFYAAHIG